MTEPAELHLAGGLFATTPAAIATALRALQAASIDVAEEVKVEGDNYDIEIYPDTDGDFLVSGSIRRSLGETRALLREIAQLLEGGGIVFRLELDYTSETEGDREEQLAHPGYVALRAARRAAKPTGPSIANGTIRLGAPLRNGTSDAVLAGTRGDEQLLVTLTTSHTEPLERLRERLAFAVDGVAPLVYLGPSDPGAPYPDALVEKLPAGQPAAPRIAEPALARLGAGVAAIAARVHATGRAILGIRPELIYVDDAARLTALVPRGPAFIAGAPIARGVRSYAVPYLSPEELTARTGGPASDVFSLCATLFFLGSGAHPFGDPTRIAELVGHVATGRVAAWPGTPALGAVLARGLATSPAQRPTAAELADALGRFA